MTSPIGSNHRWLSKYPKLGSGPLPYDHILSEESFDKQREHIFKKCWLFVGRQEQIAKKGDYFVAKVDIAQTSVVVVRQPDGSIGAFHNVCKHRGNKLMWEDSGKCGRYLVCKFHGWAFDTYGNVASIPDQENFYDLEKSKLSLHKVRVDVWQGFIFINLDDEGTESLRDYLGELADRVDGYPFETMPTRTMWRADVGSHWRVIADAQVETYHVPYLHNNSVQGAFNGKENEHCHILDFETFGPHHLLSVPFDPDFRPKGAEALAFQYGPSLIKTHEAGTYQMEAKLNRSNAKNWQFDLFHIFPNFNLLLFKDSYAIHQFWPTSINRSIWDVMLYQPTARSAAELFSQEQVKCVLREAVTEDGGTHEHTQEAIESRVAKEFYLKDEEIAIRHGYFTMDKMIKEGENAK